MQPTLSDWERRWRLESDIADLERLRDADTYADGSKWIDRAADILHALCARPTLPSPSDSEAKEERECRKVLEAAGISYDDDVRGRDLAIDDLVAVWQTLQADPDAMEAARAYVNTWPPSRSALASLVDDMALSYAALSLFPRHLIVSHRVSSPPAVLVASLGDAARTAAHERATAEKWRFQGPTASCAGADDQFLLLHRGHDNYYERAVLVRIARGDAANGVGILVGRMYREPAPESAFALRLLPPPTGASLPLPLRPYIGFVPVLLAAVLDAHDTYEGEFFPRCPHLWRRTPCTAVRSLMRVVASPAAIPPAVVRTHMDTAGALFGTRYAWLGAHELQGLLAAAAGSHAASLARLAPAHADPPSMTTAVDHDDDAMADEADRGRKHAPNRTTPYDGVTTTRRPTCPPTLAARSRAAIVRSGARVPLAILPTEVADPLAFDIWLAECAAADAAWNGSSDDHEASDSTQAANRLLDVASHWGVQPTTAQEREPHSLCGALAHVAVARGMRGGARFVPESVARVGPLLLTDDEHAAIAAACAAPKITRFLWTPDPAGLVDRVLDGHEWLSEIGTISFVHDVVDRARALIVEANDAHNVRPDHPSAATAIEPRVQILMAIAALRSGLTDLQVDDLADAGAASNRLGPLAALFP
ncbi:hypothetical protein psal_cds_1426 [Pandoravirus salinus]|uniref:Uncharacterized protein n=1 Tax=Pandoravirus salinus TaxID=1349410 RepID=S4W231_9VIRU|nr:hypothetical protein psal_cds_1426 [Pandoravirus salinus]AGO85871.1 hypothetical protein psal_cds_1426 [Pandoravirus salinus]